MKLVIMKIKIMLLSLSTILIVQCTTRKTIERPPLAQIEPVEDVYFGKKISDPYRHMENLQDSVVQKWFKSQAAYARTILHSISGRQYLIDKMHDFCVIWGGFAKSTLKYEGNSPNPPK